MRLYKHILIALLLLLVASPACAWMNAAIVGGGGSTLESGSISIQPIASGDTGQWGESIETHYVNLGSYNSTPRNMFMRYSAVEIPPGATITSASLQFTSRDNSSTTTVNGRISLSDEDDAAEVTTGPQLNALTLTTAYTDWSNLPAWITDSTYDSPDFKSAIQEVIDLPGWVSENHLLVVVKDNGSTSAENNQRAAYPYSVSAAKTPVLNVAYTFTPDALSLYRAIKTVPISSGTSITGTFASAPASGHLLVAFVGYSNFREVRTCTPPDGWTSIDKAASGNDVLETFYKVAGAGEGTDYTFAFSGSNEWRVLVIYEIVGQAETGPINQHSITTASASSITTTSVTPSVVGCLMLTAATVDAAALSSVSSGHTVIRSAKPTYHQLYAARMDDLTTDTETELTNTFTFGASDTAVAATVLIAPK